MFSDNIIRLIIVFSDVLQYVPFLPLIPIVDQDDEQCPLRIVSRLSSRLCFQPYKEIRLSVYTYILSGNVH